MAFSVTRFFLAYMLLSVLISLLRSIGCDAGGGGEDAMQTNRQPALFESHGAGPIPVLEARENSDSGAHRGLIEHWRDEALRVAANRPAAILVVSAHWEEQTVSVYTHDQPGMLYDYGGFPPESYTWKYPAPGAPGFARRALSLLRDGGVECREETERGFDHGVFVPLMFLRPEADIPVFQVSLHAGLDARKHVQIGRLLAPLLDEGVLILGSGFTFHNFAYARTEEGQREKLRVSVGFNEWVKDATGSAAHADERKSRSATCFSERDEILIAWEQTEFGPGAHARCEHLMPLHVAYGAGTATGERHLDIAYDGLCIGCRVSSMAWR